MIELMRKGEAVEVRIDSGSGVKATIRSGRIKFQDEDVAAVMLSAYEDMLFNALQTMRREEYKAGWKDAKAKRRKRTWFKGVF